MDSIVTTGSLRESGSGVVPPAVWTAQREKSVADLPFANRMRASASEP